MPTLMQLSAPRAEELRDELELLVSHLVESGACPLFQHRPMAPSELRGGLGPSPPTAQKPREAQRRLLVGSPRTSGLLVQPTQVSSHPRRAFALSFAHAPLEAAYHRWHRALYCRELRVGLLLSTFLYFLCAIAFSSWAHLAQSGATPASTRSRLYYNRVL